MGATEDPLSSLEGEKDCEVFLVRILLLFACSCSCRQARCCSRRQVIFGMFDLSIRQGMSTWIIQQITVHTVMCYSTYSLLVRAAISSFWVQFRQRILSVSQIRPSMSDALDMRGCSRFRSATRSRGLSYNDRVSGKRKSVPRNERLVSHGWTRTDSS